MTAKYPGVESVIHGNGAVAEVMSRACGGVIGYPITPSTEISEIYEAFRANGGVNVWGKHPFFFEPEGEHSAQSGALGAALTGGKYVSNASSSQGILYGMESHYVTVGKKVGGFVLHVAARVVSKHSLNVMAGHDDIYALLPSGYTVLFGSNPQEAADLAAIAYRLSALTLIPVANTMDGFATSHMLSEARMPEPELLREFLGDPAGRIKCPTVAQDMLFGAKGRAFQLRQYLARVGDGFASEDLRELARFPDRQRSGGRDRRRGRAHRCRRSRGFPRNCAPSGAASGSTPTRRERASSCRRWSTSTIPGSPAACRTSPTSRPAPSTTAPISSARSRTSPAR